MVSDSLDLPRRLSIKKRGTFLEDPFFKDAWDDYNQTVKKIVDRFNDGIFPSVERWHDAQYHSMYRTLRSARLNYSNQSTNFREEGDIYKLVIDVTEFVGGDITVRIAGGTLSVRGRMDSEMRSEYSNSGRTRDLSSGKSTQNAVGRSRDQSSGRSSQNPYPTAGRSLAAKTLHRRFVLPFDADCDVVESSLSKDAILTVTIPKKTKNVHYIPVQMEEGNKENKIRGIDEESKRSGVKRPSESPQTRRRKISQDDSFTRQKKRGEEEEITKDVERSSRRRMRDSEWKKRKKENEEKAEEDSKERRRRRSNVREGKYEDSREFLIPITMESADKVFRRKSVSDLISSQPEKEAQKNSSQKQSLGTSIEANSSIKKTRPLSQNFNYSTENARKNINILSNPSGKQNLEKDKSNSLNEDKYKMETKEDSSRSKLQSEWKTKQLNKLNSITRENPLKSYSSSIEDEDPDSPKPLISSSVFESVPIKKTRNIDIKYNYDRDHKSKAKNDRAEETSREEKLWQRAKEAKESLKNTKKDLYPKNESLFSSEMEKKDTMDEKIVSNNETPCSQMDKNYTYDDEKKIFINRSDSLVDTSLSNHNNAYDADEESDEDVIRQKSSNPHFLTPKTNATQNHTPNCLTPGGRDITVEKRQSLMEEDMFKDCWSDFSNTLQDVLNRLQELSSELGHSKLLNNDLTNEDNKKAEDIKVVENNPVGDVGSSNQDAFATSHMQSKGLGHGQSNALNLMSNKESSLLLTNDDRSNAAFGNSSAVVNDNEHRLTKEAQKRQFPKHTDGSFTGNSDGLHAGETAAVKAKVPRPISLPLDESPSAVATPRKIQIHHHRPSSLLLSDDSPLLSGLKKTSPSEAVINFNEDPLLQYSKASSSISSCGTPSNRTSATCSIGEGGHVGGTSGRSSATSSNGGIGLSPLQSSHTPGTRNITSEGSQQLPGKSNIVPSEPSKQNRSFKDREFPKKFTFSESSEDQVASSIPSEECGSSEVFGSINSLLTNEENNTSSDIRRGNLNLDSSFSDSGANYKFSSHVDEEHLESNVTEESDNEREENLPSEVNLKSSQEDSDDITDCVIDLGAKETPIDDVMGCERHLPMKSQTAFKESPVYNRHSRLQKAREGLVSEKKKCHVGKPDDTMGSLFSSRGSSRNSSSQPSTPKVSSTGSRTGTPPLSSLNRGSKQSSFEDNVLPSYMKQKTFEPARKFSGFGHVQSDNVKRMRNVWAPTPDRKPTTPSSPSLRSNTFRRSADLSSSNNRYEPASPECPRHNPKTTPVERIRSSSLRRNTPSPVRSPNSPMHFVYPETRKDSSSRNSSPVPGLGGPKSPPSSYGSRRFSPPTPPRTASPVVTRKFNNNNNQGVKDKTPTRNFSNGRDSPCRSRDSPCRFKDSSSRSSSVDSRNYSSDSGRRRSKGVARTSPPSPSVSKAHHKIFKRLRDANLQPDSEAICFKEEENKYTMVMDVEEFVSGEIDVLQDNRSLTVKGRVESQGRGGHVVAKTFNRTFNIPRNSREEQIDSALSKDGILTIFVPKKKETVIKIELVD